MERLGEHDFYMSMAFLCALRSTCSMRQVGAVFLDKHKHVIATGYNGVPRGFKHCIDTSCKGFGNINTCQAVHAEQNALLQCRDVMEIEIAYITTFPCLSCIKLLLNTSCQKIVYCFDSKHSISAHDIWSGWKIEMPVPSIINFQLRS